MTVGSAELHHFGCHEGSISIVLVKHILIGLQVEGAMIEEAHHLVALADEHVIGREAEMIDALLVELADEFEQVADGTVEEILLCHNGRILVEHLSDGKEMSHLDGQCEEPFVTLIGREVKLMAVGNLLRGLSLVLHSLGEHQVISQLIMKLDEVGESSVDQTLVEVAVRSTDTGGLTRVSCLYQLFEIHLFITIYLFTINDFDTASRKIAAKVNK